MSRPLFDNIQVIPSRFYIRANGVLRFRLMRYHPRSGRYSAEEYQIPKNDLEYYFSNNLTVDSKNRLRYENCYHVRFNAFDDYTARELDAFLERLYRRFGRRLPDEKVPVRGEPYKLPPSFAALMT